MSQLSCDYETYSEVDLRSAGLHNYATDKTTGIHCFSWGNDVLDVHTWHEDEPFPQAIGDHLENGGIITAWNAAFEVALWNECATKRYGWPRLPINQVRCSMAAAYAMGLPGALEKAAAALGIDQQKDMAGSRVMLQLAQPKADGTFWRREDAPEKFERLYEYNRQDVRTELAALQRLVPLSNDEQRIWLLDQTINQRGVQVDLPAIEAAIALVESEKKRLNARMLEVTGGVVGAATEVQLLGKWIKSRGVTLDGLAKADVLDALRLDDLPSEVRAALMIRQEAAKSSTAKLIAMKNRASADGRVRGIHQYHGAATGRWAGRGIQTQNYPRPRKGIKQKHIDNIIAHLHDSAYIDMLYGPVMDATVDCLRGMICAKPGRQLMSPDYSNIEGRVIAWLAGESWKLQAFRDFDNGIGPDLYLVSAGRIYNCSASHFNEDSPERQEGKSAELGLGFGGGVGAFQTMARIYGVKVSDARADEIKFAWRAAHPKIVQYWYACETAALRAMTEGGVHYAGASYAQVAYRKSGSFLWCKLPSGRVICFPFPEIREVETPWGELKPALTFMTVVDENTRRKGKILPDPNAKGDWQRVSTYGGDLAQSNTQGTARDILAKAMLRLEERGYPVVMHVHDQAVSEVPGYWGDDKLKEMEQIMSELPSWAAGLPVVAKGWRGLRFRK